MKNQIKTCFNNIINYLKGVIPFHTLKLLAKRWYIFFPVFISFIILGGIGSTIYRNYFTMYSATSQFRFINFARYADLASIGEIAKSQKVAEKVMVCLDMKHITHANGGKITASEISNNITFSCSVQSQLITITFANKDKTILASTLNYVLDETEKEIPNVISYYQKEKCYIEQYALVSTNSKKNEILVFTSFIFIGLVFGFLISIRVEEKNGQTKNKENVL